MFNIEIVGLKEAISAIEHKIVTVAEVIADAVDTRLQFTRDYVKERKLSGQVLNAITGNLRDSVRSEMVSASGDLIFGHVYSNKEEVPYNLIHEYGGTINHPGSSKFQAFQTPTGWVRTNYTKPHQIVMPARPYFGTTFEETAQENADFIHQEVKKEFAS